MTKAVAVSGLILAVAALYLLLWPVPVDPVAWDAPTDRGLVDPFEVNDRLESANTIDLGTHEGPEDVALGRDGFFYTTTHGGTILRIDHRGEVQPLVELGGRPLGIEVAADGSLIIANAYFGLQRVAIDGSVTTLASEVDRRRLVYVDDLAVANDGTIYFSEASTKFGAEDYGGTYQSSLLDLMEHGGHGQVIEYLPDLGEARVILDNLNFANGVAISEDQFFLLVAETGSYRILKHWLRGPEAGMTEVLIDNLPGFPDNINNGMNGRFWIGLAAPRNAFLDRFSGAPLVRKIVQRLPASLRPKAEPSSHVIAINGDGEVLMNLQDSSASLPMLTGVLETRDALYLTSLFGNRLGVLRKEDL